MKDAYDTFYFMIEEIGYYYAPFIDYFKEDLNPIFEAGRIVMAEMERAVDKLRYGSDKELHQRCETELAEQLRLSVRIVHKRNKWKQTSSHIPV